VPLTDVDITASDMHYLVTALDRQGVTLVFAEMKGPVKEKARQFGLSATIPDVRLFPTLEEAVEGLAYAVRPPTALTTQRLCGCVRGVLRRRLLRAARRSRTRPGTPAGGGMNTAFGFPLVGAGRAGLDPRYGVVAPL